MNNLGKKLHKASLACQVRTNIRFEPELSYTEMTDIFLGKISFNLLKYGEYFYSFFDECSPNLIRKYMKEQNISRSNIISIFDKLPERSEKERFREAVDYGQF